MKFYTPGKISDNIRETPEGYLLCLAVPIARTGWQLYAADECPLEPGPNGTVNVQRIPEEVFRPETIASFQGKSITIRHPDDFVEPGNWQELTHGSAQNVRRGDEDEDGEHSLLADLLITSKMAIGLVKNGLREVSCGYDAEYEQTGEGEGRQLNIVGNHIALVEEGRAGSSYAITDHKGEGIMDAKTMLEKFKARFGAKVVDEVMAEKKDDKKDDKAKDAGGEGAPTETNKSYDELKQMVSDLAGKIDGMMKPKDESTKQDPASGAPAKVDAKDEPSGIEDRLKALEQAVSKLLESKAGDEDSDKDDANKTDDEEEEETDDDDVEETTTMTGDTASRVEILAPGMKVIKGDKDIKSKALKTAYATADGKTAIDSFTGGKAPVFDQAATVDLLFIGASELLKRDRSSALSRTKTRDFNSVFDDAEQGVMTAEKMNELNAKHYAR